MVVYKEVCMAGGEPKRKEAGSERASAGGRKAGEVSEPGLRYQLTFPFHAEAQSTSGTLQDVEQKLRDLLRGDLTLGSERPAYGAHNVHAFAAKFPPQLVRLFISELTRPGEWVLDPMAGSGTVLVEAAMGGRRALGVDLDPLASLISKVKTTPLDLPMCLRVGARILREARAMRRPLADEDLRRFYSDGAISFFRYWFEDRTIHELCPLARAIDSVSDAETRAFLKVVFSSIIITKTGGLTRARDLAHSRPHRDPHKEVGRGALEAFGQRLASAVQALEDIVDAPGQAFAIRGDVRQLPLPDECAHLIVTSPPYAANAIDYVRAHKFSLVWLGHPTEELRQLRRRYIGAELPCPAPDLPSQTGLRVLRELCRKDQGRAAVVGHYFADMQVALGEMLRVTAKGRAVVLVVGSSTIRGIGIKAPAVLAELASGAGFRVVGVGRREIARDARMMPVSHRSSRQGIEARMHEEGVLGLLRPR